MAENLRPNLIPIKVNPSHRKSKQGLVGPICYSVTMSTIQTLISKSQMAGDAAHGLKNTFSKQN